VSDERLRLFVALELPTDVRAALVGWREPVLRDRPGLRALAPESLHVTLCFLGWRPAQEVQQIGEACAAAVAGAVPVSLSLQRALWLPARRPAVLAVALADPQGALEAVQARCSGALQAGGWYAPEARPFLAHVTVARVTKGARVRADELPAPEPVCFAGSRVTLFRSRLGPGGARYEPLRIVRLL
jgi:2'-5' RNA ligase